MKKLALSGIIVILAVMLFSFVSYTSVSGGSEMKEDQKVIPMTGNEKSGYSESNMTSI